MQVGILRSFLNRIRVFSVEIRLKCTLNIIIIIIILLAGRPWRHHGILHNLPPSLSIFRDSQQFCQLQASPFFDVVGGVCNIPL
jgi:hypothetical protein